MGNANGVRNLWQSGECIKDHITALTKEHAFERANRPSFSFDLLCIRTWKKKIIWFLAGLKVKIKMQQHRWTTHYLSSSRFPSIAVVKGLSASHHMSTSWFFFCVFDFCWGALLNICWCAQDYCDAAVNQFLPSFEGQAGHLKFNSRILWCTEQFTVNSMTQVLWLQKTRPPSSSSPPPQVELQWQGFTMPTVPHDL